MSDVKKHQSNRDAAAWTDRNYANLTPFPPWSYRIGPAPLRAPRSIIHVIPPGFLYVPPSGVSWLGLWPGATPPPTKRASVPAVLLKAVGALPDTDGEVDVTGSPVGRSDIVPMACAFTHDIFETALA